MRKIKTNASIENLEIKLLDLFSNHIGIEEIIYPEEIYLEIVGEDGKDNPFKRYCYWDLIIKVIRKLRREGKAFIVCQQGGYFVLKSTKEANVYINILERDIKAMEGSMIKAEEWVKEEKMEKIKKEEKRSVGGLCVMRLQKKCIKIGTSLGVVFDKIICDSYGLEEGDILDITDIKIFKKKNNISIATKKEVDSMPEESISDSKNKLVEKLK